MKKYKDYFTITIPISVIYILPVRRTAWLTELDSTVGHKHIFTQYSSSVTMA